jgi:hypothetical protein
MWALDTHSLRIASDYRAMRQKGQQFPKIGPPASAIRPPKSLGPRCPMRTAVPAEPPRGPLYTRSQSGRCVVATLDKWSSAAVGSATSTGGVGGNSVG